MRLESTLERRPRSVESRLDGSDGDAVFGREVCQRPPVQVVRDKECTLVDWQTLERSVEHVGVDGRPVRRVDGSEVIVKPRVDGDLDRKSVV